MVICFVYGCNHRSGLCFNDCRMFRFPSKDPKLRLKWEKLCRRADRRVEKFDGFCSCHFEDGIKANGPTIFPWMKHQYADPEPPRTRTKRNKAPELADQDEVVKKKKVEMWQTADTTLHTSKQNMGVNQASEQNIMGVNQASEQNMGVNQASEQNIMGVNQASKQNMVVNQRTQSPRVAVRILKDGKKANGISLIKQTVINQISKTSAALGANPVGYSCVVNAHKNNAEAALWTVVNKLKVDVENMQRQISRLECEKLLTNGRVASLEEDNKRLQSEVKTLQEHRCRAEFSVDEIIHDQDKMLMYTSIPKDLFLLIVDMLRKLEPFEYNRKWKVGSVTLPNQLFITLMKLKLNCRDLDLAHRFNCSVAAISNVFHTFLPILHKILHEGVTLHSGITLQLNFTEPSSKVNSTKPNLHIFSLVNNIPPPYKSLEKLIVEVCTALFTLRAPFLKGNSQAAGTADSELSMVRQQLTLDISSTQDTQPAGTANSELSMLSQQLTLDISSTRDTQPVLYYIV